jgi:hypothetical protein
MEREFSLSFLELILTPLYGIILYFIVNSIKSKNIRKHPYYKYFVPAWLAKAIGGIVLGLIYYYYYGGGDTLDYFFYGADSMRKLFWYSPYQFFSVIYNGINSETYTYLLNANDIIGNFGYTGDHASFFVTRFTGIIGVLSGGSYFTATLLLSALSFTGIWKLFELFLIFYPSIEKRLAIAILFIPSVVFWGSGFMKDSITISAVGWYVWGFYFCLIKKEKILINGLFIFIASFLKPYIMFALFPGSLVWYLTEFVGKVKNVFLKFIITPVMLVITCIAGYYGLLLLTENLGNYSLDKVMDRAVITQQDLKQGYYNGNSFDIGDFDASFISMLAKAPLAINASLFRPYLWEAKNPVMLISGLENIFILIFTIYLILKLKIVNIFLLFGKSPLLTFSLLFSLFFAFSVGISTSNFGALVRYKIPLLPFFFGSLFIMEYYYNNRKKYKLRI